ncbi:hypothetical protein C8J57DRAFT_1620379 [Mycena rebaudengoi]|nr:hypothetical protein C8J57DRAFT_1620379 [Mycena rebaudengoi]
MTTRRSEPDDPDNSLIMSSNPAPGAPHGQDNARAAAFRAQMLDTVRILRENTSFETTHIMSEPYVTMDIAPSCASSYDLHRSGAIHVDAGDGPGVFLYMPVGLIPYTFPGTQMNIKWACPDESTTDDKLPELESVPLTRHERRLRRRLMERSAAPRSDYLTPNPVNGKDVFLPTNWSVNMQESTIVTGNTQSRAHNTQNTLQQRCNRKTPRRELERTLINGDWTPFDLDTHAAHDDLRYGSSDAVACGGAGGCDAHPLASRGSLRCWRSFRLARALLLAAHTIAFACLRAGVAAHPIGPLPWCAHDCAIAVLGGIRIGRCFEQMMDVLAGTAYGGAPALSRASACIEYRARTRRKRVLSSGRGPRALPRFPKVYSSILMKKGVPPPLHDTPRFAKAQPWKPRHWLLRIDRKSPPPPVLGHPAAHTAPILRRTPTPCAVSGSVQPPRGSGSGGSGTSTATKR